MTKRTTEATSSLPSPPCRNPNHLNTNNIRKMRARNQNFLLKIHERRTRQTRYKDEDKHYSPTPLLPLIPQRPFFIGQHNTAENLYPIPAPAAQRETEDADNEGERCDRQYLVRMHHELRLNGLTGG